MHYILPLVLRAVAISCQDFLTNTCQYIRTNVLYGFTPLLFRWTPSNGWWWLNAPSRVGYGTQTDSWQVQKAKQLIRYSYLITQYIIITCAGGKEWIHYMYIVWKGPCVRNTATGMALTAAPGSSIVIILYLQSVMPVNLLLLQSGPVYPLLHSHVPTVILQVRLTHGGVHSE